MSNEQRQMVSVDAHALRQILVALMGNSVELREWMAIRNLPGELAKQNPINILIDDFNKGVAPDEPTTTAPAQTE